MDINDFTKDWQASKIELEYYCDDKVFDENMLWYTYGVVRIDGKLKELIIFKRDQGIEFDPTEAMEQKKQLFSADEVVIKQLDGMPNNFSKDNFNEFMVLNQNRL